MADPRMTEALFRAVDELNMTLPPERWVPKEMDAPLMGAGGSLDSLGIVNLIVAVEEHVEMAFGVLVNLVDQRTPRDGANPLESLGALGDYVEGLLREQGGL